MHVVICYVNQRIIGLLSDFSAVSDLYNNIYAYNYVIFLLFERVSFDGLHKPKLGAI